MGLNLWHFGCANRHGAWVSVAFQGRRRLLVGMLALTMLASCTLGPDFKSPDAPPVTGYLPAGDRPPGRIYVPGADIPARWWELFRSRPLNDLIETGIAHNADLQAAEAAVRVAQATALAQRGALFPQVAANWNSSRQGTPLATLTSNAANGAEIYSLHTAQVTVAYALDVWGGTRRQIESLEAQAEALAFQREGVYPYGFPHDFGALLRYGFNRTIDAHYHPTALLDLAPFQNSLGQIALPDVLVQETAAAQARMLLPPLQRQLDQQRHLLATLTGRFPSEAEAAAFQLGSFRLPRQLPLSLPADLVCQRPDVRAAEASVHAANAQVGVAIANRLPQITLSGNDGSTALAISKLFSPGTNAWLIAGNALQPVFDGGTLRYKQQGAEEAWVQSVAQYRSTVLVAFQNVADVLRALQADARALSAAVTAEQASLARVQAEAARLSDTVALFQALGGGWWNRWESTIMPPD